MIPATHLDLYQLTSLIPHWDAQRAQRAVWMSFFSRRLPRGHDGQNARDFIVWCGLRRCLHLLSQLRFDDERLETLSAHPVLGPALRARPLLVERLRAWRFHGEVWAIDEGELLWANPAVTAKGELLDIHGVRPSAMPPYLQVYTDLLTAKLIETPLLSVINHMSMVATKAAHLTRAAGDRPLLELGSRRTHIDAAVDAAVASYIGGAVGTSNVEAHHRFAVPVVGTMDHFAVQSWESESSSVSDTEFAFFKAFATAYPQSASLLVDTYDMFGEKTGIRNAVRAAAEADVQLNGIRIDSQLSPQTVERARSLLDQLGAHHTKIIVSGGVDEPLIKTLKSSPVDIYGVGERLVTSADAPVGVGAVGKLSWIDGITSMKQSRGSGKATLPGPIQAFRTDRRDRLSLVPSSPSTDAQPLPWSFAWDSLPRHPEERPLIHCVWRGEKALEERDQSTWLSTARTLRARGCEEGLMRSVFVDDSLAEEMTRKCISRV